MPSYTPPSGSGSGSGSISADDITSGTLDAARLPTGIDAAKIGDGSVDDTEFGYLHGVTSAIQTQLDGKAAAPTGTPDGTKFYRDDGVWATPAGGGGAATFEGVCAYVAPGGSQQTIAGGALGAVLLPSESVKTQASSHSTVSNTSRLVAWVDGIYRIDWEANCTSFTGIYFPAIRKNGSSFLPDSAANYPRGVNMGNGYGQGAGHIVASLAENDYVELTVQDADVSDVSVHSATVTFQLLEATA